MLTFRWEQGHLCPMYTLFYIFVSVFKTLFQPCTHTWLAMRTKIIYMSTRTYSQALVGRTRIDRTQ